MGMFSGYTSEQIATMLSEAQAALHDLVTGQQAVSIERNGRKVTYNASNIQSLRLYIQELTAASKGTTRRSPARIQF